MNWRERIHSDITVLLGKPCIKGTRISIDFIIERLANGWNEKNLLENYPRLKKEDLQAIFSYIYECLQDGLLFESKKEMV